MRLIPLYAIIFVHIFIGIVPNSTATFHSEFEADDAVRLFKLYSPYSPVQIDDPTQNENASGLYFRISQRGVDYLAGLASKGLPEIFHRLVLPTISETPLTLKDAVIVQFDQPDIGVNFVKGHGVDISILLPEIRISGAASLSVFFASYNAQMVSIVRNLTIDMRVSISRNLNEDFTNVTVTRCSVNRSVLDIRYFGLEASEFYTLGDLIQGGIDGAIRDKICLLPPLLKEFVHEQINMLMEPKKEEKTPMENKFEATNAPSVLDHVCAAQIQTADVATNSSNEGENEPEVDMQSDLDGVWVPDLTLRFPPTFSDEDLIFGIDGGIMHNGHKAPPNIPRPKFNHLSVRDQMLGIIMGEYIPNTFFYHIYKNQLGRVSVSYTLKHIPKSLRSIGQIICSDCKMVVTANLTRAPYSTIDRNGIALLLEGDIGATFRRKNQSYNIATASGQLRVGIKPHFRHSRLYSDVLLAGVDFKVYKAGLSGFVANAVKKVISFLIPHAIWPKIQQRLRLAVNYKGIQIPRICTVEFNHLHLDYMQRAAIISGDFDVDLPLLIRSFKRFMDDKIRKVRTRKELRREFRYL